MAAHIGFSFVSFENKSEELRSHPKTLGPQPDHVAAATNNAKSAASPSHTGIALDQTAERSHDTVGSGPECDRNHRLPTSARSEATPRALESSRSPDSSGHETAQVVSTWGNPPITKWRVLSACLGSLGQGFSDSAPGALLPYIEDYYTIDYAVVSTIFVANAVGFIAAAFFVQLLDRKLGRAKTMMLCEALNVVALSVMIIPPPYAVFVIGYFIIGFNFATTLALNNVFCANVAPATTTLGAFHGAYGIGGTTAPLLATLMVTSGVLFSRFYAILAGIRFLSGVCMSAAFWKWDTEQSSTNESIALEQQRVAESSAADPATAASAAIAKKRSGLFAAFRTRVTPIGALFIFAYQGAEVSISGWVISFLINARNGDPSRVGYVTAGFWGGITVGRLVLSPVAQRVGEKMFTWGLLVGAIAFEIAVWRLQSVVGDSVFIALLGLLLGPVFPCATVVFTRLLPRHLQNTAIAFIASAGSSGGAVAPFLTGILAQSAGTWVLHPIAISLYAVMMICWALLPKTSKRRE